MGQERGDSCDGARDPGASPGAGEAGAERGMHAKLRKQAGDIYELKIRPKSGNNFLII